MELFSIIFTDTKTEAKIKIVIESKPQPKSNITISFCQEYRKSEYKHKQSMIVLYLHRTIFYFCEKWKELHRLSLYKDGPMEVAADKIEQSISSAAVESMTAPAIKAKWILCL